MKLERTALDGRGILLAGSPAADTLLIQPVDDREAALLEDETEAVAALSPVPFRLAAFPVADWNGELSPWPALPAFGDEAFAGRGPETLAWVRERLLPALDAGSFGEVCIGGYSLAGLFALYAAWACGDFRGAAGVSPSVWMPGWPEYAAGNPVRAERIYLSLGDREERTRNPAMRAVGDNLRSLHALLSGTDGVRVTLEWNPGNHFRDPALRTAKGFAWLLNGRGE